MKKARKLKAADIEADITEQVRQMGREDWLEGVLECPFGEESLALQHWWEGAREAEQFPLLVLSNDLPRELP